MIQVWLTDRQGFYQGESTFVEELLENMTTEPLLIGYVKPKLVGGLWIEGATEEEITEWKQSQQIDICPEPTAEEKIAQLEQDKEALAENVYALAEIIEALIGGETDGQASTVTETTTD